MATFEQALFQLWPHGDFKIPGLRAAIVATAPRVFETYGLNTKTAILQFMAQISHECGAGTEVEENLSYSAQRMTEVWPSRFKTVSEALAYAHNPQALGNKVYNGRMGNAIGSNDGYTFRGRGATQTTGRSGYNLLGTKLGLNLIGQPDLVNAPNTFLECGAADFQICGCILPALSNDIIKVTEKLNGGQEGLAQRIQWHSKWEALNIEIPVWTGSSHPAPNMVQSAPKPATGLLAFLKSLVNRG